MPLSTHLAVLSAGYAEQATIGEGDLGSGTQMVTKPFSMEALAQHIREMVG